MQQLSGFSSSVFPISLSSQIEMRYDVCLFDQGDVVSFENDDDDAQEEVGVEYDDGDGEGPRPLFIICLLLLLLWRE